MDVTFQGRARKFGDDINTDYIIASSRKKETLNTSVLKRFLLEGVDPGFAATVQAGDLIVAGKNFGCGSAMEIAVTVIQAAGIRAVLAESFSRTFFRNAVNNGLFPIEYDTSTINEGDKLTIELHGGQLTVANGSTCVRASVRSSIPGLMLEILEKGGLVPYIRAHGGFGTRTT